MKIVFMGTPAFAVPVLQRLCKGGLPPVVVYCQPARPRGRGRRMEQSPAACASVAAGIDLRQPSVLQRRAELAQLEKLAPDLIVTAAYGKIFRRRLLELPRLGCINLHPSLLPRYRGLSPIQSAILRGDAVTGVTVYRMTPGVDSGPILLQQVVAIDPRDTAGSLGQRLALLGGELTFQAVQGLAAGQLKGFEQDHALATHAPRLERDDGLLDWRLPAQQIGRLVRALDPWPGTFCYLGPRRIKLLRVRVVDELARRIPPGTVLSADGKRVPVVAALPGAVALEQLQREGCRPQDGAAFCRGQRIQTGQRFSARPRKVGGRHG